MKHTVLGSVLLASLLVLAGCTAGLPLGSDGQSATTVIYLSDAPIDEFEYLNVTVSKVGISDREFDLEVEQEIEFEEGLGADAPVVEAAYEFEYDPAQWTESDVDVTVDLTQLQGDRATRIAALDLPSGDYGAVYVEVSRIEGVLKTGERVTFVQPEGKILLSTGFT
ncbi:MAG: DUF4382 domain-containing protein, partial [Halobacteriales archaeon]|nr:DUF4382 domain-containing protein [Halobacteriales archaeon]